MGPLNLIWIIVFIYYGFRLLIPGLGLVEYKAWDEIIGILLLASSGFGIFCMTTNAAGKINQLRNKKHSAVFAGKRVSSNDSVNKSEFEE